MKKSLAVCAMALAAIMAAGVAAARTGKCAKPEEISAVQTAAVQQELMVAALTCNEIARFNAFQTGFGPELRASDAVLAKMFKRLYGARQGAAEYHAFKTRLANDSSMRSIHDNPGYCREAGAILSSALSGTRVRLTEFIATVQVVQASPIDSCQVRIAVARPGGIPDVYPKPKPEIAAAGTPGDLSR